MTTPDLPTRPAPAGEPAPRAGDPDTHAGEPDTRVAALEARVRQLEAQLLEAQRQVSEANRLKTEFLARMSHDLRTPMNAIIGYARLLLRRTKKQIDARQYRNLENIQTSAHSLLDLINDILDLSKIEAGRVEVRAAAVDLATLARECCAAVEPRLAPGVELDCTIEGDTQVTTDAERLRRALMNLLGNAAKFTEAGRIWVSLTGVDGHVDIDVRDTGVGIDPEELPHIFDEFRQVARKGSNALQGTGLGLAIVKRSTELIGGSVAVASRQGEGTCFTLRIPNMETGT